MSRIAEFELGGPSRRRSIDWVPISFWMAWLQARFTVGTETNKLKDVVARFAVNQNQVGPDMAIAMVGPIARQWVINVATGQGGYRRAAYLRPPPEGYPVSGQEPQISRGGNRA